MGIPVNDKLGLGVAACDHHIPVWGGGKGYRLIGVTATAEAQVRIYIHLYHSVISIKWYLRRPDSDLFEAHYLLILLIIAKPHGRDEEIAQIHLQLIRAGPPTSGLMLSPPTVLN